MSFHINCLNSFSVVDSSQSVDDDSIPSIHDVYKFVSFILESSFAENENLGLHYNFLFSILNLLLHYHLA